MASHAIAFGGGHVFRVVEAQVFSSEFCSSSCRRIRVAAEAITIGVRLGVAAHAIALRGKVRRTFFARSRHVGVALLAVDPLHHVLSVRKCDSGRMRAETQNAGARGEHHAEREEDGKRCAAHRSSHVRETRARALSSNA